MKLLTQTGRNCWQTCVAMLLELPAESLPNQHFFDENDRSKYAQELRVYLFKHHGLTYVEIEAGRFSEFASKVTYHVMMGETVRTNENGAHHAVVGLVGKMYWDVSPTRAGLTRTFKWGMLVKPAECGLMDWVRREVEGRPCSCPACLEQLPSRLESSLVSRH